MRIALVAVLGVLMACSAPAEKWPQPLDIGAAAPAFELPGIDGKTYTLDSFADAKVLALVFTCNHCPTAQAYEDRIQALHREYGPKGVAVVAVSPNDPLALRLDELGYTDLSDGFEDTKQRAADKGFEFVYLYDGDTQAMSREYGPISTPHVFVFDQDRKLRFRGRIDDSEKLANVSVHDTRNALDALLAGKPVPVETTKTSGCSVKWSEKRGSVEESLAAWAKEPVNLTPADEAALREIIANKTDKVRLVNVWATWCGPCVTEFPELVTIQRMYKTRPFEVVTISADEPAKAEDVLKFLKSKEASMTNLHFSGEDRYAMIEAIDPEWEGAFPYTLLIKPGGEIVYRSMGAFDSLELKRAIVEQVGRYFD